MLDTYHEVKVKSEAGYALVAINEVEERYFVLKPRVNSISPNKGSTKGGTVLTVYVWSYFLP